MKKIHINKNNFVCEVFPFFKIDENCKEIEITDELFDMITTGRVGYAWKFEGGEFVLSEHFDDEYIRRKRTSLLEAFDKYKTNVFYGIENETDEQKRIILDWYRDLLNLSENSIKNIPDRITYYL